MKRIACRIEYGDAGQLTIRLPAKDICRIHMQLELLKSGKLRELVLKDVCGGSISVDAPLIGGVLIDNVLELLEQGFTACGDISWMHIDDEVNAAGKLIEVAVGFFY